MEAIVTYRLWVDDNGTMADGLDVSDVVKMLAHKANKRPEVHFEPSSANGVMCEYFATCVREATDVLDMPRGLIHTCKECRELCARLGG